MAEQRLGSLCRVTTIAAGLLSLALTPNASLLAQTVSASAAFDSADSVAVAAGKAWLEANKISDDEVFEEAVRNLYSNYGFMLMGRIVETVTGLSYDDYVARHIWDPAGMASTGNQPESVELPLRAVGYMGSPGQLARADDSLPHRGTPAGGDYSTVGDFTRFATALVQGKLMKPETLDMLVQGGVKLPDGTLVPYDFGGTISGKGRWIGHGGAAPGMSGLLMHFLDSGYTIVALANRDSPASDAIVNFAAHRLPAN